MQLSLYTLTINRRGRPPVRITGLWASSFAALDTGWRLLEGWADACGLGVEPGVAA